eukprot:jgi/Botrbrau1/13526/Bobra.0347s0010.2
MEGGLALPCFANPPRRHSVRPATIRGPLCAGYEFLNAHNCRILSSSLSLSEFRVRAHPVLFWDRSLDCSAQAEPRKHVAVRVTKGGVELERIAWLRAEAYYEDQPPVRYIDSFKKTFREQETRSLMLRTSPGTAGVPECVCLVAVEEADGQERVLGSLDMRPPASAGGRQPVGVPQEDREGVHVLNVVVDPGRRREGVGEALMQAAASVSKAQWGATSMYTHVVADNEPALNLYRKCGFTVFEDEGSPFQTAGASTTTSLGRRLLLRVLL